MAQVAQAKSDANADKPAAQAAAAEKPAAGGEAAAPAPAMGKKPDVKLPEVWADPGQDNMDFSPERMQVLESLAKRREELDAREKQLAMKEALVKTAEKQMNAKVEELTKLKSDIEQLLDKQSEEEKARTQSLVKIYETMKAKDAAAIFDQLDMDILLQVVSRMKEAKSSPIIAAMNPDRAKELTVRLAEQKKLPGLPEDTAAPDLNLPTQ